MAALLASTPGTYVDPRASILYGGGNSKITDDEIRAYIKSPGVTDKDVMAKALANNVSASQISKAMGDNPGYAQPNVDKYLTDQGITKEQTPTQYAVPEAAAAPAAVTFKPITVGTNDTVQGQLNNMLGDPNNPLQVRTATLGKQYANRRGMLDSSIGADAAVGALIDRSTPIASQDATTNFTAKQNNAQGALSADTFNADVTSRTNMFNTGAAKDIFMGDMDTQNKLKLAEMDTKNRFAIANLEAMAADSGIMGDLAKTAMSAYTQIITDDSLSPEVKTASVNRIFSDTRGFLSLLPSIEAAALATTFDKMSTDAEATGTATTPDADASVGSVPAAAKQANILNYQVEPSVMGNVKAYERVTGVKVDPGKVAPEQLVMDIKNLYQLPTAYLATDGTNKMTNSNAYDPAALMEQYKVKNVGELFNAMFAPVHPPGTMRADNPMFYVYQ